MSTQTAFSSSSSTPQRKYDVFLSFYGKDTRKNFTDHLYAALKQKGIFAFRDDEELERGEFIDSGLLKAIEESKYAVLVLSRNYAFSRWCLIELAKIVQCRKEIGLVILPVFYHVDPSHVRHQADTFSEAFGLHEQDPRVVKGDVQTWRAALREVGKISGWHLHDGHESTVVKQIIARIFRERNSELQSISYDIVGIEFRMVEMMNLLGIGSDDVRFIGVSGMVGVGKTTLAGIIYDRISYEFDACSFIYRVSQEHDLVYLQRKLLSEILMEREIINTWDDRRVNNEIGRRLRTMRILLILDDVNENKQLEALAGSHEWFGRGSRVIVTSREEQVLNSHGVCNIYPVKKLSDGEALQLFCWKAFKKPHPEENYVDLSKDFVNYAKGIPLTLKVWGTSLFGKRIDEWKIARDQLKENPDRGIVLDLPPQQEEYLRFVWIGIFKENIFVVSVSETPNLRVIVQKKISHKGDQVPEFQSDEHAINQLKQLLSQIGDPILLILDDIWSGSESLLEKFEFHMSNYNILVTSGRKLPRFSFTYKLKPLNDEGAITSFLSPDEKIVNKEWPAGLCDTVHLKKLSINNCDKLSALPEEIGNLENLEEIRLTSCTALSNLPDTIGMLYGLHTLDISHCTALSNLPETIGRLRGLHILRISHCPTFSNLPDTIGMLYGLHILEIFDCPTLSNLPETIGMLRALHILHISHCPALSKLPDTIGMLLGLRILCISHCSVFSNLPDTIGRLHGLQILTLSHCPILSNLPETIGMLQGLRILRISDCPVFSNLPDTIGMLHGLFILGVSHCAALSNLPDTIGMLHGLRILGISHCPAFSNLSETIGRLRGLRILGISHCSAFSKLPNTIGMLHGLQILDIS